MATACSGDGDPLPPALIVAPAASPCSGGAPAPVSPPAPPASCARSGRCPLRPPRPSSSSPLGGPSGRGAAALSSQPPLSPSSRSPSLCSAEPGRWLSPPRAGLCRRFAAVAVADAAFELVSGEWDARCSLAGEWGSPPAGAVLGCHWPLRPGLRPLDVAPAGGQRVPGNVPGSAGGSP